MYKSFTNFTSSCILLLSLISCRTSPDLLAAQDAYKHNNLPQANANITRFIRDNPGEKNNLIAHLELGSILIAQNKFDQAKQAFQIADQIIKTQELEPDISLSKEALANISNLNALTYKATAYDKIMVSSYLALINLQQNNHDAARAHLFNAFERQKNAVHLNAEKIQKAIDAQSLQANQKIPAFLDTASQNKIKNHFKTLDEFHHYKNYINPFSEFLQALYFLHSNVEDNDYERARVSFNRLKDITPNTYISHDLLRAQNAIKSIPSQPTTYVIFETGTAPSRKETKIQLPLFLVSKDVSYYAVSFPNLNPNPNFQPQLNIQTGTQKHQTQIICDMDAVVATEFKNKLPITITKSIIAAASKAALTHYARKVGEKNEHQDFSAGQLLHLIGILYQSASNHADLRTWASLPKQFQYASFQTPATRQLTLQTPNHQPVTLSINQGHTNVIYVKCINNGAPLQITQFKLN